MVESYRTASFICEVLIHANYATCCGLTDLILQLYLYLRFTIIMIALHMSQSCDLCFV